MPNWPGEPRFCLMLDGISATEWLEQADFCYVNRTTKPGYQGFLLAIYTWGDKCRGTKYQWGGLMRGDIDLMEGDLTSIDYIIN